ncbi:MAG: hypothetical protein ACFBSF_16360 [Leptolyngbyaceae cyanobacterium]
MSNDFGIIYVATGKKYRDECVKSAQSAKKVMPDIPITLWTDSDVELAKDAFDFIHILESPKYSFFDKISPLIETKHEKTLFVDTDTYFLDSVYEFSDLLERFELGYCHAPWRISPGMHNVVESIPLCFAEPNTGVIPYRKTETVIQVFQAWERIYAEQLKGDNPPAHDQPAFREALYFSDIRSVILPPEYNVRTVYPVFVGGCPAKILHGREPSLGRAIKRINEYSDLRIYDFNNYRIKKAIKTVKKNYRLLKKIIKK